ncbi:hypothetical protein GCM10027176_68090 [Actinoallomurus bryophytorum]|uniref:Carbohydrate binding protein with CBM6 domain n=1 Tax=Actinoallomurus bryophytorum TaxID=1490222 RepID=A0A543CTS9_9ACTN|nr:carbohydrate-binding protein [Actinoallomurus bryophytorum]TQM00507.1 carbohydrate binding protein with CBM6 domain [Actinoallomurus bryophytorum]
MNDPKQNERRGQERGDLVGAFTRGAWQPSVQPQVGPRMLAGGIVLIVVAGAAFGAGAMTSYDHKRAAEERSRELALTSRYPSVDRAGRTGATTVPGVPRPSVDAPRGGIPSKRASRPDTPGRPGAEGPRTEPAPTPAPTGSPALTVPLKAPAGDGADDEKGADRAGGRRKVAERSSQQGGETAPHTLLTLPEPEKTPTPTERPDRSEWPTIRTGPPPTTPPQGGTRSAEHDAYSPIQAEALDRQSNLGTENTGDTGGGQNLAWISDGDWALYKGVGFGLDGARRFYGRVASGAAAGVSGRVEVRLDALSNAPVGGFAIANTGGWQTYGTVEADVRKVTGVHDVYLRFSSGQPGDFVNLHWFAFGH